MFKWDRWSVLADGKDIYSILVEKTHTNRACPIHMDKPTVIKTFMCEVRWPVPDKQECWPANDRLPLVDQIMDIIVASTIRAVACNSRGDTKVNHYSQWRPNWAHNSHTVEYTMQKLFTIEVRVDFRDEDKLPLMQTIVQQAARQVIAQAGLLGDVVKPQVAIYGHDYFVGHADIPMFDDDIATGQRAITDAGNKALTTRAPTGVVGGEPVPEGFSTELMEALKG